jgi:hypothetical protein
VVETVLKLSVDQKTADNITVVMVCFKNFKKSLKRELGAIENIPDTEDTNEDIQVALNSGKAEIS